MSSTSSSSASAADPTEQANIRHIEAGISEFYKIKERYEKKTREMKEKFLSKEMNRGLSVAEKRNGLKLLHVCELCRKPCKMTFSTENGELRITCDAPSNPCNRVIVKSKPKYGHLETIMNERYEDIGELKDKIIRLKLDLLFNYSTEDKTAADFGKMQKRMTEAFSKYDYFRLKYYDATANIEHSKRMAELKKEIDTAIQQKIKNTLSPPGSVVGVSQPVVRDTVNYSTTVLMPLIERYSKEKFACNEVMIDYDNIKQYRLVQKKAGFGMNDLVLPIMAAKL
jgi:hypothetical protein